MKRNYYLVEVMCGHVGRNCYIPIIFPVVAESATRAAEISRTIPRVKHNNKNAVLHVIQVTKERYDLQIELNNDDEYLNWKIKGGDVDYSKILYRVVSIQREYSTTWEDKQCETMHSKAKKSTTDKLRLKEIKNIELHINDYFNDLEVEEEIIPEDLLDIPEEHICRSSQNSWLSQPVLQF